MKMLNPLARAGVKTLYTLIGFAAIVILVASLIAGFGILASLLAGVLVVIIIYFGSLMELAGSIVVGCLLKTFSAEIHSFAGVWWTGESSKRFFDQVNGVGYFNLIAVIFFFAYTLSFLTGRVKLFNVKVETSVAKKEEE